MILKVHHGNSNTYRTCQRTPAHLVNAGEEPGTGGQEGAFDVQSGKFHNLLRPGLQAAFEFRLCLGRGRAFGSVCCRCHLLTCCAGGYILENVGVAVQDAPPADGPRDDFRFALHILNIDEATVGLLMQA